MGAGHVEGLEVRGRVGLGADGQQEEREAMATPGGGRETTHCHLLRYTLHANMQCTT